MGYYTKYELIGAPQELVDELRDNSNEAQYALDESGETRDETKWYEHEDDMKILSRNHPETLFTLEGTGEETGDYWRKYFKNGKVQRAKMSFSDYNEFE